MSLEVVRSSLARGETHLGDLAFWALEDADVERTTLERVWTTAGLSTDLLPDVPSPERALKLAAREAQVGQKDLLIRVAKEASDELAFGVVREERDASGVLRYHQEATVHLDRGSARLTADAALHPVVQTIRAGFERYRNIHTADDVRAAIVKALRSFAYVPLRPGGPPYYIPSPFAEQVRALQHAIEQIGASKFYLLPCHGTEEAQRTLSEVARSSLEEELETLQQEIASFVESPPERASTLLRRIEAFDALRSRARLYRDVLSVRVRDLDQQLDVLTSKVEGLLEAKSGAESDASRIH